MNSEMKVLALKQYFKFFLGWFIALAVLIVICVGVGIYAANKPSVVENTNVPSQRVFDYADRMTDQEEKALSEFIRQCELEKKIHIVLVTENRFIEYGEEYLAMNLADEFYDDHNFGFDKVHGDGFLIYDFYAGPGDSYAWLSTCGDVERDFDDEDIDEVLSCISDSDYLDYKSAIRKAVNLYDSKFLGGIGGYVVAVIIGVIVAFIFAASNLAQKKAAVTTTPGTYLSAQPVFNGKVDNFLRKNVVATKIETSSSGRSGGGGGHHTSSRGVSHGGGGRRH